MANFIQLFNNDLININYNANYSDINAGYKPIYIYNIAQTNPNYVVTISTIIYGNINPKPIIVNIYPNNKYYDTNYIASINYTVSGALELFTISSYIANFRLNSAKNNIIVDISNALAKPDNQ